MGVRGAKRHLKRLNAPKHWMLDKMGGVWAPKPSAGPHKTRECVPLIVLLRNRLKYALTYHEAKMIVKQRLVSVDGKPRTEMRYPAGFMGAQLRPHSNRDPPAARATGACRSSLELRQRGCMAGLAPRGGAALCSRDRRCSPSCRSSLGCAARAPPRARTAPDALALRVRLASFMT